MDKIRNYKINDIVNTLKQQLTAEESYHLNAISIFDIEDNDGNNKSDGFLNTNELIKYMKYLKESCNSLLDKILNYKIKNNIIDNTQIHDLFWTDEIFQNTVNKNEDDKIKLKVQVLNEILKELEKHDDVKQSNVDLPYWTEKIAKASSEYEVPCEIIIAIISRETKGNFTKNVNSATGKGPMQITSASVRSFLEGAKGNWHNKYQELDSKLLNDIENHLKKANKHSVNDVLDECAKDDDFGIKVGILIYKMKYAEAVNAHINGKSTYANISKTIKELLNNEIKLTSQENEKCIENATRNYNGNKNLKVSYAKDVINSLKRFKFDFNQILIKTSTSNSLSQGNEYET